MSLRRLATGSILFSLLISGAALAAEFDSFHEWAIANAGHPDRGERSLDFGSLIDSFPANNMWPIGLAYDEAENGLWLANEDGGELLLIAADPPHNVIRSINIQDFRITVDGNQDGVAVIGDDLYVTDFQGDQYMVDDLIYRIHRVSGALIGWWYVDGPLNPNPNASINTILGISDDGAGNFWVTDNEGNLHNVTLLPGGGWVQNSVEMVPGGGVWAGIDYDNCLADFFTANLATAVFGYHTDMPAPPFISAAAVGPNVSGITSNNNGMIWTVGFEDDIIYLHEGISCPVPVAETTWGSIKGLYR